MVQRGFVLILLLIVMLGTRFLDLFGITERVSPTLILGFMMLAAYCFGYILERIQLPRITSYIFTGLLLGPYLISLIPKDSIVELNFINSLALAFIAFCAGGELKTSNIRKQILPIVNLVLSQTLIVFFGVFLVVFFLIRTIPVFSELRFAQRLVVAMIFGVISIARSPSSTIAIISETKAKGDYTDIVLSVTIVKDVIVIVVFGIIVSLCQVIISTEASFDWLFFLILVFEILVAFILGFLLGKGIIYLIETVKIEFPVVIIGIGFLVIKFSHFFTEYLQNIHDIAINLEPLLICMAAGFTVQNFSDHGKRFLTRMDSISLPIYIIFFTVAGASINLDVLKSSWIFGIAIVAVRLAMLYLSSIFSGVTSGVPSLWYRNYWLGFITQAGVSVGLLTEIVRRFPTVGIPVQSLLIAAITINQLIGPVAFKFALNRVGDAHRRTEKTMQSSVDSLP